jgi:hypothetical protein
MIKVPSFRIDITQMWSKLPYAELFWLLVVAPLHFTALCRIKIYVNASQTHVASVDATYLLCLCYLKLGRGEVRAAMLSDFPRVTTKKVYWIKPVKLGSHMPGITSAKVAGNPCKGWWNIMKLKIKYQYINAQNLSLRVRTATLSRLEYYSSFTRGRGHIFVMGRLNTPLGVLMVTTRMLLSEPGCVSKITPVGHWSGVKLSSRTKTMFPGWRLDWLCCHQWGCCKAWK